MGFIDTKFYHGIAHTATGDKILYTVPSGKVAIVTEWTSHTNSNSRNSTMFMYPGSGAVLAYGERVFSRTSLQGFYVVPAGQSIQHGCNIYDSPIHSNVQGLLGDVGDTVGGGVPTKVYAGAPATTAATSVYTVPTGKTLVLKNISVANLSGANATACVRISGIHHITPYGDVFGPNQARSYNMTAVINAGQVLSVESRSGASTVNYTMNGLLY